MYFDKSLGFLRQPGFAVSRLHFYIQAVDDLVVPVWKGNFVRNLLSAWWAPSACRYHTDETGDGEGHNALCGWEDTFQGVIDDPRAVADMVSRLPPWTLHVPDLREKIPAGDVLEVEITLLGSYTSVMGAQHFGLAFSHLNKQFVRIGPKGQQGRAQFAGAVSIDPNTGDEKLIWDPRRNTGFLADEPMVLNWDWVQRCAQSLNPQRVSVFFHTPTRIKHRGQLNDQPDFPVFFTALMRRLELICRYHCGIELDQLEPNVAELHDLASEIRLANFGVHWKDWGRFSKRQKSNMTLGGFVGIATYEGGLEPFLPWLAAAQLVGIGGRTTFGNGVVSVFS